MGKFRKAASVIFVSIAFLSVQLEFCYADDCAPKSTFGLMGVTASLGALGAILVGLVMNQTSSPKHESHSSDFPIDKYFIHPVILSESTNTLVSADEKKVSGTIVVKNGGAQTVEKFELNTDPSLVTISSISSCLSPTASGETCEFEVEFNGSNSNEDKNIRLKVVGDNEDTSDAISVKLISRRYDRIINPVTEDSSAKSVNGNIKGLAALKKNGTEFIYAITSYEDTLNYKDPYIVNDYVNSVYRSSDQGNTWTPVNTGLVLAKSEQLCSLIMSKNILYIGTSEGRIFKLDGMDWAMEFDGNSGKVSFANHGNELYASIGKEIFKLDYETNSWKALNLIGPDLANRKIQKLYSDGSDLYLLATSNDGKEVHLYRLSDQDPYTVETIEFFTAPVPVLSAPAIVGHNGSLYLGFGTKLYGIGIYKNSSPEICQYSFVQDILSLAVYNDALYIGVAGEGIYKSPIKDNNFLDYASGGKLSATKEEGDLLTIASPEILLLLSHGGNLYAGDKNVGVFRTNGDSLWISANNDGVSGKSCSASYYHNKKLYLATKNNGVFVSSNGTFWKSCSNGLKGAAAITALHPHKGKLYAGTNNVVTSYSELFCFDEDNNNWAKISVKLNVSSNPRGKISSLASDGKYLYVVAPRSTVEGPINPNHRRIYKVTVDSNNSAATCEEGTYSNICSDTDFSELLLIDGTLFAVTEDSGGAHNGVYMQSEPESKSWTLAVNSRVNFISMASTGEELHCGAYNGSIYHYNTTSNIPFSSSKRTDVTSNTRIEKLHCHNEYYLYASVGEGKAGAIHRLLYNGKDTWGSFDSSIGDATSIGAATTMLSVEADLYIGTAAGIFKKL